ncbi:HET-domain-containing protein [Parathielavia hyrcaniae]|uniref:HET-domain-containing protein n=1 Tax=Parathielavia hyrcaniae TaxID=113614 RepID=A0AAN6SXW2_9PEZI|nr:HET-domain-containing protein [Parathielavia hyrcaniae]
MRLINTRTLEFAEFLGSSNPKYAILSHTWGDDEVTLQDMIMTRDPPSTGLLTKEGYRKVVDYCRLAAQQGHEWAWVDTCCIDKTNHAELAESINSMFRFYEDAAVCHVFLSDLAADADLGDALPHCRWFTRGWTLQELIAPEVVELYDQSWVLRGTKANLIDKLESITGILGGVLKWWIRLPEVSVAARMSWAANRETTRLEDRAYSMLGIFDVNMPLIYGEGEKAFRRLQEEIIRQSNDLTILAWQPQNLNPAVFLKVARSSPPLALSPLDFSNHSAHFTKTGGFRQPAQKLRWENGTKWSSPNPEYAITNKGLKITTSLAMLEPHGLPDYLHGKGTSGRSYFLALGEAQRDLGVGYKELQIHGRIVGMLLDKLEPDVFSRRPGPLCEIPETVVPTLTQSTAIYITKGTIHNYSANGLPITRLGTFTVCYGTVPVQLEEANGYWDYQRGLPPFPATVRTTRAIPEGYWNHAYQRFFCAPGHTTVLAVGLVLSLNQHDVNLLCLIDQRPLSHPVLSLYHAGGHPDLMRWFKSSRAARESTFWEDLPVHWLQWPGLGDSLKISLNGVSYSVHVFAQVHSETQQTAILGSHPKWEMGLEVVCHGAASDV